MAGCRADATPLLIASVQAACDPAFGLYSVQATTHPCAVLMLVSGPAVGALGLHCGHGAFGPDFRANATAGRAMRLILMNVGGGIPGQGDQSTQGSPAKFSYCVAENEAATPWAPFRVTRGFPREDSTVTVFSGEGPHNVNDHVCTSAETTLTVIADTMTTIGHNNAGSVDRDDDEALCPIVDRPEDIHVVVTGGPGKHSAFIPTFGTSKPVTRRIT